jgi:hypothetical protein
MAGRAVQSGPYTSQGKQGRQQEMSMEQTTQAESRKVYVAPTLEVEERLVEVLELTPPSGLTTGKLIHM